jgi:hypothetical protein
VAGRERPMQARQRAMRKLAENEQRTQAKLDKVLVRPGFREGVEELMRGRWDEPVIVLRLDENFDLGFDVPGRRLDGTVKGKRLVRRFLWNIVRGVGGVVFNIFTLFNAGGMGNPFRREIRVTGAANAMALELLDPMRSVSGPWLACSPSHLAVVDTGSTYLDLADAPAPKVLWETDRPRGAEVSFRTRTITWPDGSAFRFPLHGNTEVRHLREYYEFPDIIHWHGRSGSAAGEGGA